MGTNSLGWCVLGLNQQGEPERIINAGARIFSDGRDSKTRETLKASRRLARSARRRRDRFKQRQKFLLIELEKHGLFPSRLETKNFSSIKELSHHIEHLGGVPTNKAEAAKLQALNPLELRARAVSEKLKPYEIGRALFHLNQRRGFQSNRKDKSDADGKVARSFDKLLYEMKLALNPLHTKKTFKKDATVEEKKRIREQNKQTKRQQTEERKQSIHKLHNDPKLTYGVFLYNQQKQGAASRVRPSADDKLYNFYPMRLMYKDEFDKIMRVQKAHHPDVLTPEVIQRLKHVIFHQRPLKPAVRGQCAYLTSEKRTFRGMPSFQRYRILQEVNSVEWRSGGKTHKLFDHPKARDAVVKKLEQHSSKGIQLTWATLRREISKHIDGLSEREFKLNFEANGRRGFDVNLCSHALAHEDCIGPDWHTWSLDKQDQLAALLLDENLPDFNMQNEKAEVASTNKVAKKLKPASNSEDEDEKIKQQLMQDFGLDEFQAEACLQAHLPDDTASLSLKAARVLFEYMRDERCLQTDAVKQVAKKYKHFKDPARFKKDTENYKPEAQLEYYGKVFQDGRHIIPGTLSDDDRHDDLKYYGGLTNPTVHISLNQIRHVVNELIQRYGHPASIAIELGRELPAGKEKLSEIKKQQNKNKNDNERIDQKLKDLGQMTNRDNRLRYQLWEELSSDDMNGRLCPFTGQKIGMSDLFSAKVEVEHLLPFSQTLDDSRANKVVCMRQANRDKGNKAPYEAFGHSPKGYDWKAIERRIQTLSRIKQDKFREDAMEKWLEENENFSERHLNDTRYIGRVAREYLEQICCIDKIDVVTGRLTFLLRKHWGLNTILRDTGQDYKKEALKSGDNVIKFPQAKNRDDHRHHAVDALVVGMTTRSILQKVSTANACAVKELGCIDKLFVKNDDGTSPIDPWPHFRMDAREIMQNIIVSHKIRRKTLNCSMTDGQLHNETALGVIKKMNGGKKSKKESLSKQMPVKVKDRLRPEKNIAAHLSLVKSDWLVDKYQVVVRKTMDKFSKKTDILKIRDPELRRQFLQAFEQGGVKNMLKLASQKGIRRLRCVQESLVIPMVNKNGSKYKAYLADGNWGIEIYEYPKGHKKEGAWQGCVISRFHANQKDKIQKCHQTGKVIKIQGFQKGVTYRPHPASRLVMRLQINDCIEVDEDNGRKIFRMQKLSTNGSMFFAPLYEANTAARAEGKMRHVDPFKYLITSATSLQKLKAKKVHISSTGRVQCERRASKKLNGDVA